MKTAILDFNSIANATFFTLENNEMKCEFINDILDEWKIRIFNTIKKNILRHSPNEFIIACDSSSWRKKFFKFYKAKRKQIRDEANLDYQAFIDALCKITEEITDNFPYKVIKIHGCEADDIIAVLSLSLQQVREEIVIISADKDFKQLVSNKVKLYNHKENDFVKCENPKRFLIEHIFKGDTSDGIPNFLSDDDVFIVDGKRQKPCGPKKIEKILEQGIREFFSENPQFKKNYYRNKKLIELSLNTIPQKLWDSILETYKKMENKPFDAMKIMLYFSRNGMTDHSSNIKQFKLKK
jgi:5'-3' exonuclease